MAVLSRAPSSWPAHVWVPACCKTIGGCGCRKSSGKCSSALITGYGMKPPSAQREPNFMVWQRSRSRSQICLWLFAGGDAVDHLHAAHRADAAGRALAAGFLGAELHGKSRLLREIDGVVEHDDAAVADQSVAGGERLVIEWRVEQRGREIRAQRPADLHGAHRPAGQRCRRRCRSPVRRASRRSRPRTDRHI